MGRGRSGRVSATPAERTTSGNPAAHPAISDINAFGELNTGRKSKQHTDPDARGPSIDSIEWFRNNMGMSIADARRAADTVLFFSRGGDNFMHNNLDEGNGKANNKIIDAVIDNPMSPTYSRQQFRGLLFKNADFNGDAATAVRSIISNGKWAENGASSFSASFSVARRFARWSGMFNNSGVSVILHYTGGDGMPIKHLSSFPSEDEVLHSRKQMTSGYRIVNHRWTDSRHVEIWLDK